MQVSFSQIVHGLVGLIKYAVALVLLVAAAKLLPIWWGNTCYLDPEDAGMREALGKTTVKVAFDPGSWNEEELQRGQIVVLNQAYRSGESEGRRDFPFRVVAVEGDIIESQRGVYKINDEPEKYPGGQLRRNEVATVQKQVVPRGYVYLLPDDRISNMGGCPELVPVWRVRGRVEQ